MNSWSRELRSPREKNRLDMFTKAVGRGINRFGMIRDGEKVLIGVSGGKDSLALSMALKERLQRVPISCELAGLLIQWREHPIAPQALDLIRGFFDRLGVPLSVVEAAMFPESFRGKFDCYLCARNKKRLLFQEAERLGFSTIAMGHHQDDFIETTLMNIFFNGEFSTMMPVQEFFGGKFRMIRPMCEVPERLVRNFARNFNLPVASIDCPKKDRTQRKHMKEIISSLAHVNKKVRDNIYSCPWNINTEYLITSCAPEHSLKPGHTGPARP